MGKGSHFNHINLMATESAKNPETLKTYVNDMVALQKHILETTERQAGSDDVKAEAQTIELIVKVKHTLTQQVEDLEKQVARLGSGPTAAAKQAVGHVMGIFAGLYDHVRKDPVSRMLRDGYTALNLSSISYTMLHTTGLAYHDQAVADLALSHLQQLTPLIMRYNEIIPNVVAAELSDEGPGIDTGVGAQAIENTQEAWKPQG